MTHGVVRRKRIYINKFQVQRGFKEEGIVTLTFSNANWVQGIADTCKHTYIHIFFFELGYKVFYRENIFIKHT